MVPRRLRILAALLAAGVASACSAVMVGGPELAAGYAAHGVDVSKYQGEIDWSTVRRHGIDFAYLKATEGGDRIDDRFAENWRKAAAAGIHRGAYHFWYHCRPGREQAAWFIANVPKDDDALPPVLDMEWTPFSPTCRERPPASTLHAEMRDFLRAVEAHYGKRPVIYTSVDFFEDRMAGAFHDHHLWVRSVAGHPSVRYGARPWRIWQYTGTGFAEGVDGEVDLNLFRGSDAEFARFVAGDLPP